MYTYLHMCFFSAWHAACRGTPIGVQRLWLCNATRGVPHTACNSNSELALVSLESWRGQGSPKETCRAEVRLIGCIRHYACKRVHLRRNGRRRVSLIVTGGLLRPLLPEQVSGLRSSLSETRSALLKRSLIQEQSIPRLGRFASLFTPIWHATRKHWNSAR